MGSQNQFNADCHCDFIDRVQFEVDMGKFMKRRPTRAENRVVTEVKKEIKDEPEDVVEVLGEDETWETIDLDQASSATSFNSYGNQRAKGKDNLRKLCSKSQSIRKKCTPDWGAGICAVLKKGMMPINAQINKMLPEALEYLNNNIPKALGILVPFAINKLYTRQTRIGPGNTGFLHNKQDCSG